MTDNRRALITDHMRWFVLFSVTPSPPLHNGWFTPSIRRFWRILRDNPHIPDLLCAFNPSGCTVIVDHPACYAPISRSFFYANIIHGNPSCFFSLYFSFEKTSSLRNIPFYKTATHAKPTLIQYPSWKAYRSCLRADNNGMSAIVDKLRIPNR